MALSGSTDFTLSRDEIAAAILRKMGGAKPLSAQISTKNQAAHVAQSVNLMLKAWQTEGIGLWKAAEITLVCDTTSTYYDIGPSSADHMSTTVVKTEIATAAAAAATTIVVDSYTGMTDGDVCGVELDDGTVQWTTLDTPASTSLTIDDALTDTVAVDNHVYTYTALPARPLAITEARLIRADGTETPMDVVTWDKYTEIADKSAGGNPTMACYRPVLTNGKLYVWPISDSVQKRIIFTARIPVDDLDAAANNADIPVEGLRALIWNGALEILPEYDVPPDRANRIERMAISTLMSLQAYDYEMGSVYFDVDNR